MAGPFDEEEGRLLVRPACSNEFIRAAIFRVSYRGEGIDDADTIEGARGIVRGQSPGRYDVDEIRAEPFPSGHTSRQWGRLIQHPDGRVEDEKWPWPE
jgi:hypothetical protein